MRKLITLLTALFSLNAMAAASRTIEANVTEGFQSNQNLLINGNFGSGLQGWAATGLTAASVSTAANVARGDKSASIDPSATGQYFTSTAVAIPAGLYARNGLGRCLVKTDATDLLLQAYDGTNILSSVTVPASSTFIPVSVNFIFPSTGNISLRFASQSNSAIAYVDDCYLGDALNLINVSQAQFIGDVKVTGCSTAWSTTSATMTDFGTKTGCTYATTGNLSAPSTNLPGFTLKNAKPGTYIFTYHGTMFNLAAVKSWFQFFDGTNYAPEQVMTSPTAIDFTNYTQQKITYTTAQGDLQIRLRGSTQATGTAYVNGTTSDPGVFSVYYYPPSSQIAVTPEVTSKMGGARWTATSGAKKSNTATSYTKFTDSDFATNRTNIGVGVNPSSTSDMAFKINAAQPGNWEVTFHGWMLSYSASVDHGCSWAITDGTTTYNANRVYGAAGSENSSVGTVTAIFNYAAVGDHEWTLLSKASGTNGECIVDFDTGDTDTGFLAYAKPLDQSIPNPVILNQVSTSSAGGVRVEGVSVQGVCNSTPCTLVSNTGGFTSVTRSATGVYTANFVAGTYSAAPNCTVTAGDASGYEDVARLDSSITTSGFSFVTMGSNTAAKHDADFSIICIGSK